MSVTLLANEISGLALQSYNSGNVNRKFINTISSNSHIKFMHSGVRYNSISSQYISAGTILTQDLILHADTISGLANPLWPSSAVNKHYVDIISSNLDAKIDAIEGLDGATVSSNFFLKGSGNTLWDWYTNSSSRISEFVASGDEYSSAYLSAQRVIDSFDHKDYMTSTNAIANFVESGGTKWTDLTDGGETSLHTHTGLGGTTFWSSQTNKSAGSIYYDGGKVIVAPSGTDYGNYRFQVSGDVFLSGSVTFKGAGLSGLADPTYNSGASNKHYVDTISSSIITHIDNNYYTQTWIDALSGSIDSRIDGLGSFDATNYITSTNSIARFTDSSNVNWTKITAISSGFDGRLDILEGYDEFDHELYITSANAISKFPDSSNIYNRAWIDTFSGNIDTRIDAISDTPTNWTTLDTDGTTLNDIDAVGVSGSSPASLSVNMDNFIASSTGISKFLASSDFSTWRNSVDSTEMGYLDGVTSDIQTQLDSKDSLGDMTWNSPTSASGVTLVGTAGVSGNIKVTLSDIPQDVIKSGTNWQKAYISTSTGIFANASHTHDGMASNWTWNTPTTTSGLSYSGDGKVSGSLALYIDDYIASANVISKLNSRPLGTTISSNFFLVGSGNSLYNFSSNSRNLYHPSGYGKFSYISSNIISGGSITTASFSLIGNTISGLIDPIYPSAASNKHYVDTISSNLNTKIGTGGLDGATVSSNFFLIGSGNTLWDWYSNSSSRISEFIASGDEYSTHIGSDGSDHSFIDQNVTIGSAPTFTADNFSDGGSNAIITTTQETNFTSAYTWYTESSSKLSTISGSLSDRINALSDTPTTWGTLTEGTGIAPLTGVGISGSGDNDITVLGYATISSNAANAYNWTNASSQRYENLLASGTKYSQAYASAQRVGDLFNHNLYITSSNSLSKFQASGVVPEHLSVTSISSSTISGGTITTGDFVLNANTISGLIDPTWPSSAANKHYVDTISSNLATKDLDFTESSPASGEVLVYKADSSEWQNELPSMTFNVANVLLYSGQNINVTRYSSSTPTYVWQACACNSGGASAGDLYIELLRNGSSVYKTSSNKLQQGYPLAKGEAGEMEIRFMYSSESGYGSEESSLQYGTGFMQISVY